MNSVFTKYFTFEDQKYILYFEKKNMHLTSISFKEACQTPSLLAQEQSHVLELCMRNKVFLSLTVTC